MIQQLFNSYSSLELDVNNSVQSIRHQLLSSPQLPSSKKLNRSQLKHRLTSLRQSKENLSKQSTTEQYQQQFFDSKGSYLTRVHNNDDSEGLDIFRVIQKLNITEAEKEMLRNYAEEAESTIDELHQLIEEYVEKLEESLQKNVNLQKSIQMSPLACRQVSKLQQALQQCFRENLQLGKKLQQSLLTQKQLRSQLSIYQQQIPIISTNTTSSLQSLKQIITQHQSTIKTLETKLQLQSESFKEMCRLQAQANAAMLEKYIQENRELKEMSKQGDSFKLANETRQSKLIDEEGREVQSDRKEEQVREKQKEEQRNQMKERNRAEDQIYEEEMFQLGLKLQSMRKKSQTIQKLLQPKPLASNIQQFYPVTQEIDQIPIQPKSQPKPFHSLEINSQAYLSSLTPLQKQVMSPVTYKLALRIITSILLRQEVLLKQTLDNSKLSEDQKDMIQHKVVGFWDLRKKVQAKLKDLKDSDTGDDFSFATD